MDRAHNVEKAFIQGKVLHLTIDGQGYEFDMEQVFSVLAVADLDKLNNFEISPSGYGIHWPELDEDLSIDGLLGISHRPERKVTCLEQ